MRLLTADWEIFSTVLVSIIVPVFDSVTRVSRFSIIGRIHAAGGCIIFPAFAFFIDAARQQCRTVARSRCMSIEIVIVVAVVLTSMLLGVLGMAGGILLMALLVSLKSIAAAMIIHGVVQATSNGSRAWLLRR